MAALTAEILGKAKRVTLKIGSALLVDQNSGRLRRGWLAGIAEDIARLRENGAEVLVVSSGSIALGRRLLKLPKGALSLEQAQAAAATGQIALAQAWSEALLPEDIRAAQVLLTIEDTRDRRRYLNGRATLNTLLDMGVVPIVNENDTVATDEIRFGDNDRLAARVALMAGADVLVLLSDVDGLYTDNPRANPDAKHFDLVEAITPEIEAMGQGAGTDAGTGGMRTKLMAAKTAMEGGCAMAIAHGGRIQPISALLDGDANVTWFKGAATARRARKAWIAGMKPEAIVIVDAGAAKALQDGKSLLPAGVVRIEGEFERGDTIAIHDVDGHSVGAALVGYDSREARLIVGKKSAQIAEALGHPGRATLAHRDDMVVWSGNDADLAHGVEGD